MEAWRSTCPRYTVWEDALAAQFVKVERGVRLRMGEARVTLTPRGQAVVAGPRSPFELIRYLSYRSFCSIDSIFCRADS
jgi:hypothetical protein